MANNNFSTKGLRKSTKSKDIKSLRCRLSVWSDYYLYSMITSNYLIKLLKQGFLRFTEFSTVLLLLFLTQRCAPVFSEMQSARLVQKGGVEASGIYSNVGFAEDGEADHIQNHIGVRFAYGFSDEVNVRFGYENVFESGEDGAHIVGIGPKFQILPDRIAAYLPIGTAFGSNISTSDSWQIQPTALFTIPITSNIEFNPSAKWLIPLSSDQENQVALNFGAGLSTDINRWAIRPEIGLLYNPGSGGHYTHYSVGFTFYPLFEDDCCPQKLHKNR